MTYSTSNPPFVIAQGLGGTQSRKVWLYVSTDGQTDVRVDSYFSDGYALGMRAGDIVFAIDTNASPIDFSVHCVNSASSSAGVDLEDGTALGSSDSD